MATDALDRPARRRLLGIAREAIRARLEGAEHVDTERDDPALEAPMGAFVSLHGPHDRLRGCIGTFVGSKPLRDTVAEMAEAAAFRDPRFSPLEPTDLPGVEVEISALSPLRRVENTSEIEVGRHGLEVSRGYHRGVLLPQVAVRHGWSRERFLEETCRKAGLPGDAWRDPETRIAVFTAEVFSERDLGGEDG